MPERAVGGSGRGRALPHLRAEPAQSADRTLQGVGRIPAASWVSLGLALTNSGPCQHGHAGYNHLRCLSYSAAAWTRRDNSRSQCGVLTCLMNMEGANR